MRVEHHRPAGRRRGARGHGEARAHFLGAHRDEGRRRAVDAAALGRGEVGRGALLVDGQLDECVPLVEGRVGRPACARAGGVGAGRGRAAAALHPRVGRGHGARGDAGGEAVEQPARVGDGEDGRAHEVGVGEVLLDDPGAQRRIGGPGERLPCVGGRGRLEHRGEVGRGGDVGAALALEALREHQRIGARRQRVAVVGPHAQPVAAHVAVGAGVRLQRQSARRALARGELHQSHRGVGLQLHRGEVDGAVEAVDDGGRVAVRLGGQGLEVAAQQVEAEGRRGVLGVAREVDAPGGIAQRVVGEGQAVEVFLHRGVVALAGEHEERGLGRGLRGGAGGARPAGAGDGGQGRGHAVRGLVGAQGHGGARALDAQQALRALEAQGAGLAEVVVGGGQALGEEVLAVEPALERRGAVGVTLAGRALGAGAAGGALAPGAVGRAVAADALDAQQAGRPVGGGAVAFADQRCRVARQPVAALRAGQAGAAEAGALRRADGRVGLRAGAAEERERGQHGAHDVARGHAVAPGTGRCRGYHRM